MKMEDLINAFPQQLLDAVEIGKKSVFTTKDLVINNVVISGLGGSGIGGRIISQMVSGEISVPVITNNDYHLPNFVSSKSLVIISSYSGNTEETLSAMNIALDRGAEVACITSGGLVLEKAKELGLNYIQIPGGLPPRASFGLNSPQLLYILSHYGLISHSFEEKLNLSAKLLIENTSDIQAKAKELAKKLHGRTPIIYTNPTYEGVGVRFRQQINENAKMLCWHHVFPEMNHNELVGWAGGSNSYAVVMFRTEDDYTKTQLRMNLSKAIFKKYTDSIVEVHAKGNSIIERSYYLIYFGDWVSYYLAEEKGVDPMEVDVIEGLKSELAKH